MPLCALVVFGAIVGVWGDDLPAQPTDKIDHHLRLAGGFHLKDLCFFGKLPSTACDEKCKSLHMVPYCYKDTNECLCKPGKVPMDDQGSAGDPFPATQETVDYTDESSGNVPIILYISDFVRLRPLVAGTEDEDYTGESEDSKWSPLPARMHPDAVPIYEDDFLWSKEHVAMVLIVAMILALVAVELCIMYRKRKSNNYLENLFQRTPLDKRVVASFK